MHTNNITVPKDSVIVVVAVSVSEIKPFRLLSFGTDNIIIYIFFVLTGLIQEGSQLSSIIVKMPADKIVFIVPKSTIVYV